MALSPRFDDALVMASELHRAQLRKGTAVPYVAHLLSVAALVIEHGGDEDQAIAALLHDAVEDQGGAATAERIRARFGEGVHAIVLGCTDADTLPKPPWRARKEAYIAHVRTAPARTKLVSAADKLHNARSILADMRDMGDEIWTRFTGGREGSLWYYQEMVKALREGEQTPGLRRLVDELARVVAQLG